MLQKFLKRHKLKHIIVLFVEEYFGGIMRVIPGYEGMIFRWVFYKITFNKIGKLSLVWKNVYFTHSYNIKAGDKLAINFGSHIDGRGGITFGNYVLIGPNVFIGSSNHYVDSTLENPRIFLGHLNKETIIGNNVWIGANCSILPGVRIGDNSIIGSGSVVTKDIPSNVIAAGNPAKIIKEINSI